MSLKAPPLLINFDSKENLLKALSNDTRNKYERDITNCINYGLPPAVSLRVISTLFGFSTGFISHLYKFTEKYYRVFSITKGRHKEKRKIYAPQISLKIIQKWLSYHLSNNLPFRDSVFGFIPGRSTIQAANLHCNAKWIYNVDIKDFFPSIDNESVHENLIDIGYSDYAAKLITKFACYKTFLAQGSPASPVLSNIIFRNADLDFESIASKYNITYTRYADDIVFSCSNSDSSRVSDLKNDVHKIFVKHGYEISPQKEHFAELPHRLKVHGLLVHNSFPRLTKGYRNKIRAFRHMWQNDKIAEQDKNKILGHLSYAHSVESYTDKT